MLEFLDDYILTTLQTEWEKLVGAPGDAAPDFSVWQASFNQGSVLKHLETAYATFVTDKEKLIFYHAWNPKLFTISQYTVAISLDVQAADGEFFANADGDGVTLGSDDADNDSISTREVGTIGIYAIAPKKPVLSFICYFIRRAIASATFDIVHDLGIDNVHNMRSAAMVAPPEMAPNGVPLIYGRKMEIDAELIDTTTRMGGGKLVEKKPALVHEPQDGIDALVNRVTGAETPLAATVFGKVRARPPQ